MIAQKKRNISNGYEYDHLFKKSLNGTVLIKKDVSIPETVDYIAKRAIETMPETANFAKVIRGKSIGETCQNIWNFVYKHIDYELDRPKKEQVKDPVRLWGDKRGDCDCYTLFISSTLCNLGLKHALRVTEYANKGFFQHIYPIVFDPSRKKGYWTVDCVADHFDEEVPFTTKKDKIMDLYQLNGFENPQLYGTGLGKTIFGKIIKKVGDAIGKVGRFVNRYVNVGTVTIRNGVLLLIKEDFMNVAERLRWGYLPKAQAMQISGMSSSDYDKVYKGLKRLNTVYWQAGGKKDNLRKAILEHKGNKDGKVPKTANFNVGSEEENPNEIFRLNDGTTFQLDVDREKGGWKTLVNGKHNGGNEQIALENDNMYGKNAEKKYYMWDKGGKKWKEVSPSYIPAEAKSLLDIDMQLSTSPLDITTNLEGLGSTHVPVIEFRSVPTESDILSGLIGFNGVVGFDGLGVIVAAAPIAAGTSVLSAIAALLPKIGSAAKAVADTGIVQSIISKDGGKLDAGNLLNTASSFLNKDGADPSKAGTFLNMASSLIPKPAAPAPAPVPEAPKSSGIINIASGLVTSLVKPPAPAPVPAPAPAPVPVPSFVPNDAQTKAFGMDMLNWYTANYAKPDIKDKSFFTMIRTTPYVVENSKLDSVKNAQQYRYNYMKYINYSADKLISDLMRLGIPDQKVAPPAPAPVVFYPNDNDTKALFTTWKNWYITNKDRSDLKNLSFYEGVFNKTLSGYSMIEAANQYNKLDDYRSKYVSYHKNQRSPIEADLKRLGFPDFRNYAVQPAPQPAAAPQTAFTQPAAAPQTAFTQPAAAPQTAFTSSLTNQQPANSLVAQPAATTTTTTKTDGKKTNYLPYIIAGGLAAVGIGVAVATSGNSNQKGVSGLPKSNKKTAKKKQVSGPKKGTPQKLKISSI